MTFSSTAFLTSEADSSFSRCDCSCTHKVCTSSLAWFETENMNQHHQLFQGKDRNRETANVKGGQVDSELSNITHNHHYQTYYGVGVGGVIILYKLIAGRCNSDQISSWQTCTGETQVQSILKLTGWSEVGYKQIRELVMTVILLHIHTSFITWAYLQLCPTAWPAKQILMLVEFPQLFVRELFLFLNCGQGIRMRNLITIIFTPSHHLLGVEEKLQIKPATSWYSTRHFNHSATQSRF